MLDQSRDHNTLTLNGTTFPKGLGTHAASELTLSTLGAACSRFTASVGVDDEVGDTAGSVVFQVFADRTKVYDSGLDERLDGYHCQRRRQR